MKENEEEVQYYYDSSADQWWCFDEHQQCWVPWKEEESDDAGGSESTATASGVTSETAANSAATEDAATPQNATSESADTEETREHTTDTSEKSTSSAEHGYSEENGGKGHHTLSGGLAAASVAARVKNAGAQQSATPASPGAGRGATTAESERATDHERTPKEGEAAAEADTAAAPKATHRWATEAGGDIDSGGGPKPRARVTERRAESGAAAAADGEDRLRRHIVEEKKNNREKEEDASAGEIDRLRSALESLATSRSLEQVLVQMGSSGGPDGRISVATGGGRVVPDLAKERTASAAAGSAASQRSTDGPANIVGLPGTRLPAKIDEEHTDEGSEGGGEEEEDDEKAELPDLPKHDPIVRRSTRMLTFKDKGGLSGCLREAAKQRNFMIKEAGGYIPGTEQYREEAWKQRARELASQTHVQAQRRWRDAAKKVFDTSGGRAPHDKVMHFSDLVDKIRRKSEGDRELMKRAQEDLSRFASYSLGTMSTLPAKSATSVDPEVAASLLLKPDVDLRERRRRSSGFPGGQQGHVRFADAAFRDPNSQLQMQDLLAQQSRRKIGYKEESAASSVGGLSKQDSDESAE